MYRLFVVVCVATSTAVSVPLGPYGGFGGGAGQFYGGAEKFGAGGGGFAGGFGPGYGGVGKAGGIAPFYGGIEKVGPVGFAEAGPGIAVAEGGLGFPGKFEYGAPGLKYGGAGVGGAGFGGAGVGGAGFGGAGLGGAGLEFGGAKLGGPGLVGAGLEFGGPKFGGAGLGGAGLAYGGPKLGGAGLAGPVGFGGGALVGAGGLEGGEYINKNVYGGGKKDLKDLRFEAGTGKKGEEFEESAEGFKKGNAAAKNIKSDSAFYADEGAGKKLAEDGKAYGGAQHFNKEGKNGLEKKVKQGHKKGHVIKGFKSSHNKDESGKTEEYYDEENDEGENYGVNGQSGSFGEAAQSSFKGAKEDEEFKANQGKKHGKYDVEHFVDKNNGEGGQYGSKKFGGSGSSFGFEKGEGDESLFGEHEDSKFIKKKPFFY